jgi:hypothetical protein
MENTLSHCELRVEERQRLVGYIKKEFQATIRSQSVLAFPQAYSLCGITIKICLLFRRIGAMNVTTANSP